MNYIESLLMGGRGLLNKRHANSCREMPIALMGILIFDCKRYFNKNRGKYKWRLGDLAGGMTAENFPIERGVRRTRI